MIMRVFLQLLLVTNACSRAPVRTDHRLLIDNLPRDMSWQDLKDFARKFGDVVFSDVYGERGRNRVVESLRFHSVCMQTQLCQGVVEYRTREDMRVALREMDGYDIRGNILRVREV